MLISRKFARAFQSSENKICISESFMMMSLGDIKLASFLSQIFYWHIPSKNEDKYKLRVKLDDEYWLAKSDKDWFKECFLTYDEIRKVKVKAVKLGLIKTCIKKFNGNPTTHITLTDKFEPVLEKCNDHLLDYDFPDNKDDLLECINHLSIYNNTTNSFCVKSTKRCASKTQNDVRKKHKTLTENTTENTNKKNSFTNVKRSADRKISRNDSKQGYSCSTSKIDLSLKNEQDKILAHWKSCNGKVHKTETTKGMIKIRTNIEELLSPGRNPYAPVEDELLTKKWTSDEIISCIDYFVHDLKKNTSSLYFDQFILLRFRNHKFKSARDYSPLVMCFNQSSEIQKTEFSDDLKCRLIEKLHGRKFSTIDPNEELIYDNRIIPEKTIIQAASYLEEINKKYQFNSGKHIAYVFYEYIKEKLNNLDWQLNYMASSDFGKEFENVLIKRNYIRKKQAMKRYKIAGRECTKEEYEKQTKKQYGKRNR